MIIDFLSTQSDTSDVFFLSLLYIDINWYSKNTILKTSQAIVFLLEEICASLTGKSVKWAEKFSPFLIDQAEDNKKDKTKLFDDSPIVFGCWKSAV